MTPQEMLKDIKYKWTHSKMDYVDSKWLIARVEQLEAVLEELKANIGFGGRDNLESALLKIFVALGQPIPEALKKEVARHPFKTG